MFAGDFFVVVIGDRGAFVYLPEAIDGAGVEQEGSGQLGLAGTAVPHKGHVPDAGCVVDLHASDPPPLAQSRGGRIGASYTPRDRSGQSVISSTWGLVTNAGC